VKRLVFSAIAAVLLTGCFQSETGPRSFDINTATATPASADPQSAQQLVANTSDSYVTMVVYEASLKDLQRRDTMPDAVTSGSGFVIDSAGHVLTAGHVGVARGWYVSLTGPNGRIYRGKVKEIREDHDMALIQITDPGGLKPVVPVDDPCLRTGDPILSLGKPRERTNTARFGSVASMSFGRPVRYKGFGYPDAMVLRLETRKGESGGPVFDARGRLAGMVVSTLSDGAGRPLNLAHAVTAPMIADFVCSATACSSAWRSLAGRAAAKCTGAIARNTNG
jgi:S1-C subfamily serine protease